MNHSHTTRRRFLESSVAGILGAAAAPGLAAWSRESSSSKRAMPYRMLGGTGEKVSLLCVGGHHIGRPDEATAIRIIQEAVDHGVNFMDNAWEYHGGASEERMGKALKGRRDRVFLMTKHHGRQDRKTAMEHLEDSLRRLKTEVIDLWQFHEVVYDDDPDMIFSPGGAIEAADLAKKQGKVRYVGFTGHKKPEIHLKMLAYGYPWDAVQMPLNVLDASFRSFEQWVLPVLVRRKIGVLAMKTRAAGRIVTEGIATAEECWRYVTALSISTVVSGMESLELLRDNVRLATTLEPMTAEEMKEIRGRVEKVAMTGDVEKFKTSRRFDGPVGRRIHGI
jgi:aryl-alcohol dehydrogenase-like predicted oxidoreductase